jgi:hypothetical protein
MKKTQHDPTRICAAGRFFSFVWFHWAQLDGIFLAIVTVIRLYGCARAGELCYVGHIGDCGCLALSENTTRAFASSRFDVTNNAVAADILATLSAGDAWAGALVHAYVAGTV